MEWRLSRRTVLQCTPAVVAVPGVAGAGRETGADWRQPVGAGLRWFGANGWEIAFAGKRVLIDPWLTRLSADGFDASTPLATDRDVLDAHIGGADLVLVTHAHFDHIADVPHLMSRFPGARVVGTETHAHLLVAMGVDERQVIWVRGGEVLEFDGFTVEVIPSLHSLNAEHRYLFPGTLTARPPRPRTIGDLVEGGTLAYQITLGGRFSVFNTGAANVVERALPGLRPDVAILSYTNAPGTHRYLERALTALGRPPIVIPSHHDDMRTPLTAAAIDPELMRRFTETVARTSPGSTVLRPVPLRTLAL